MDQKLYDFCVNQAVSNKLRKEWAAKQRSYLLGGTISRLGACFSVVKENLTSKDHNSVCHGSLNSNHAGTVAVVTLPISLDTATKAGWTEEGLLTYYRHITNNGPMAYLFVNKDPKHFMKHGFIINAIDVPGCHVLMACIQTRMPWELASMKISPFKVEWYQHMVKAGVNPNIAELVMGGLRPFFQYKNNKVDKWMIEGYSNRLVGNGHSAWDWGRGKTRETWLNIINGKPNTPSGRLAPLAKGGYFGVHALFSQGESSGYDYPFRVKLNQIVESFKPEVDKVVESGFYSRTTIKGDQDFEGLFNALTQCVLEWQDFVINSEEDAEYA